MISVNNINNTNNYTPVQNMVNSSEVKNVNTSNFKEDKVDIKANLSTNSQNFVIELSSNNLDSFISTITNKLGSTGLQVQANINSFDAASLLAD